MLRNNERCKLYDEEITVLNELSMAAEDSLAKPKIFEALAAGVDRLSAWADLLDSINVFPVADGDTGRNLVISLQPLKRPFESGEELIEALLMSARGNSGNIAAQFFSAFVLIESLQGIKGMVEQGRVLAWRAVTDPKDGTMLSVFDALAKALNRFDGVLDPEGIEDVLNSLEQTVFDTSEQLKELSSAGVVDAGALGMFIFFDGFFNVLFNQAVPFRSIAETFENLLVVNPLWQSDGDDGYCIDAVLKLGPENERKPFSAISQAGQEVVTLEHGDFVKVHLHAADEAGARKRLQQVGNLVNWKSDDLKAQMKEYLSIPKTQALHIMSESYINLGTPKATPRPTWNRKDSTAKCGKEPPLPRPRHPSLNAISGISRRPVSIHKPSICAWGPGTREITRR
jgi:dihydroxyacetone kinase-like predicted kinase